MPCYQCNECNPFLQLVAPHAWLVASILNLSAADSGCESLAHAVTAQYKDAPYKDNIVVRTKRLGTNHCTWTATVPLSKDNLMYGQFAWEQMQSA